MQRQLICILLLWLWCNPLGAIDRDRKLDRLHHTAWTAQDGSPGEIRTLAQTRDGYLWLGTSSGLFRFDGVRFELFHLAAGALEPPVQTLLAVPDGGLWIGLRSGRVAYLKNGHVQTYGVQEGLPTQPVSALATDQQGTVWAMSGAGGVTRLEGARWRSIGEDWGFSGAPFSAFVDRHGTLWIGTMEGVRVLRKGERTFQSAAVQLKYVLRIAESNDGTLWMAETMRSVRPVPLRDKPLTTSGREIKVGSQAILFDTQGSLWITSLGDGLRRVTNPEQSNLNVETFTRKDGLTGDRMYCLLQDREGNIWAGTNRGLDRFRQTPLVAVDTPADSPVSALVEGDDNTVWAGLLPAGPMQRIQSGIATPVEGTLRHLDHAYRDAEGVVWLANPYHVLRFADEKRHPVSFSQESIRPGDGLHLGKGVEMRPLRLPAGAVTPENRVQALTKDALGRVWISISGKGTYRWHRGHWITLESLGGPPGSASAEFTDRQGRVWFGFTERTVAVLDGDKVQTFSQRDGVPVDRISSFEEHGNRIWIGGDEGLAVFHQGRFHSALPAGGGPFRGITGLVAGQGLWLNESRGVIHIPEQELEAFQRNVGHRLAFEEFGLLDGLPSPRQAPLASASALKTSDGMLWFATTGGIVWVDPKRLSRNALPPPVSIEKITASGRVYSVSEPFELPPRTSNLQIAYAGLSLAIPERVRFRYWLEGVDPDWQDAGARREAFYTNLGPGSYRFRVLASNNDGIWNEAGAAISFSIAPAFYQTWWFRSICGLMAAGALWSLYLLRMKQLTMQIQMRLGERLAERERIARELHDTLLQGVQGLILHFEAVMKKIPAAEPTRQMMEKVLQTADQVLLEGRDRVRDLRSEAASRPELSTLVSTCGEEFRHGGTIAFKVALAGSVRTLDPIVREEAYLIGREALANAFRHARASAIEAELAYDSAHLRLRVRDDGIGIDQETLNRGLPGHWGLSGMRERAQKFGGELKIWSRPGAGTEIELTIPAKIAYPADTRSFRSRWRRR